MSEQSGNKQQSIGSVIGSILSAFIGVQNRKKMEDDFAHGKASTFIIAGLIGTIVFVLSVIGLVKLVMSIAVP
jgi:hypothetical protein